MMEPKHNYFIISLSGLNIDISIINIEEMVAYCKDRKRPANVTTQKKTYESLDKVNYSLVFNYTNPKPRVVNTKDKQYLQVYTYLSEKFKNGLLIAESDTLSDSISDLLCQSNKWESNDIDIMVCRDYKSVTDNELKCANFLRISADPDLDSTVFMRLGPIFGEVLGTIMIAQFFVNSNYEKASKYIAHKSKEYTDNGLSDFTDYYELNKQLAYFVHVDIINNKILNVSKKVLLPEIIDMANAGILPIPKDKIEAFAEMITI